MSMKTRKAAFTLIELLVVIAIIAILAAILFPVFAAAKESAKKTAALTHAKQVGTATVIYSADYDDLFPMTSMINSSHEWSTHGADVPADWRWDPAANASAADFFARSNSFWANALYPYMKNDQLLKADVREVNVFTNPPRKRPTRVALAMNGFLNTMSQTSVDNVSRVPMFWYGYGAQQFIGVALQQPRLNCNGPVQRVCRFPNAHYSTYGDMGYTRRVFPGIPESVYTGGNINVHTDTSAKFYKMAQPGSVDNFSPTDPYSDYDLDGSALSAPACRRPGDTLYFWCQFRPDFDYNYSNWEVVKQ